MVGADKSNVVNKPAGKGHWDELGVNGKTILK
jgi:hypothetical protein